MLFSDLGLTPELLRAVAEKSYTQPTPVQLQAIPAVLAGSDVLAGAQTGTGKTAAFVLPILQKLAAASGRAPRALVLTPTRELAAQVADNARQYGKYTSVRAQVIFGGVSINPQISGLRAGCDLLIATPGRLLDLANQGAVDLRSVGTLVLDEADRMLDMGFIRDIRRILKLLPAQRQNLLFSATYSDDIRELAHSLLRNPVQVEVAVRNATADRVDQMVYRVPKEHKRHLLAHLIDDGNWHQVLVFTRTKHGANRLAQQLQGAGIEAAAIHGNKSQGARVRALADFKANRVTALVATEVAARGLDIKELPHVVNYELPTVPEDYVHRIGRTARAGATGQAVSLVSPDEAPLLKDIERLLKRTLQVMTLPQFTVVSAPAAQGRSQDDGVDDGRDRGQNQNQDQGGEVGRVRAFARSHGGAAAQEPRRDRSAAGRGPRRDGPRQGQPRQGRNPGDAPGSGQRSGPGRDQGAGQGQRQGQRPGQRQGAGRRTDSGQWPGQEARSGSGQRPGQGQRPGSGQRWGGGGNGGGRGHRGVGQERPATGEESGYQRRRFY
jgi:ATP-dependent RNA helicase RhlE